MEVTKWDIGAAVQLLEDTPDELLSWRHSGWCGCGVWRDESERRRAVRRSWLRWRVKALARWRMRKECELEQQRQLREVERQECRPWQHPQEAGMRAGQEGRRLISGRS